MMHTNHHIMFADSRNLKDIEDDSIDKGDMILDPFFGTGTTIFSAITSARNSIDIEYDVHFKEILMDNLNTLQEFANRRIEERIMSHRKFVHNRIQSGKALKYRNALHDFPVMTRQEKNMEFEYMTDIRFNGSVDIGVSYTPLRKIHGFTTKNLLYSKRPVCFRP